MSAILLPQSNFLDNQNSRWARTANPHGLTAASVGSYWVSLACNPDEIREAQRLRYDIFKAEYGAVFQTPNSGFDQDEFDDHCDHIIVREKSSQQVVGTYRVLLPQRAKALGRYYSQNEFFITRMQRQIASLAELGRSCVHPGHRSGAVIMMLWTAISRYMREQGCTHIMGCVSVSMTDGGSRAATLWDYFYKNTEIDPVLEVFPKNPLPLETIERENSIHIPPLLRSYLKFGARVCGEPSWDPDFNTADFLMLIDLSTVNPRYAKHFNL